MSSRGMSRLRWSRADSAFIQGGRIDVVERKLSVALWSANSMSMNLRHVAALLLTVLACTSPSVALPSENCQDKLVGNSYYCTMFFESGEPPLAGGFLTSACIKFVTGNLSNNFDLVAVAFGLLGASRLRMRMRNNKL